MSVQPTGNPPVAADSADSTRPDPRWAESAAVVVGVDGTKGSFLAVRWAAETASQRGRALLIAHGLDVSSVHAALGGYATTAPSLIAEIRMRGTHLVAAARRLAHEIAPDLTVATEVSDANPAALLISHSQTAHVVVLGVTPGVCACAHVGSTLLAVVAHGSGAVVVVRSAEAIPTPPAGGPVVVGFDGTPPGAAAVAAAFAEAADRATELVAVHVWSDLDFAEFAGYPVLDIPVEAIESAEDVLLGQRLANWQQKFPDVEVTRKVYPSGIRQHLIDLSKDARLIVVGSRGRGGFRGLLFGSTSNFLVQHAFCPVMVVHPD
ncbi:universal stress protein [Nocardia australiensis]|uniref:universal stress protein n=1 Tax=Nocardia australiensis TaxID=2887191 RepID=UPI001D159D50|nr:universal stress protein [Nocardia australiensis]